MSGVGKLIHLRHISLRRGVAVMACTGAPIRTGTRLQFANFPAKATCQKCVQTITKQLARADRRQVEVLR